MPVIDRIAGFHAELTDMAARYPRPSRARLRGAAHLRSRRRQARELRHRGASRHRQDRRRRPAAGRQFAARDRAARRHGLPADPGGQQLRATARTHEGRMHACGHDGHTTMLLGAARYLAETRNFDGTVHFIFQPAEEGLGGAEAMVKDGLFDRFPCDAIFGMHNRPGLAVGKFQIRPGADDGGRRLFRHRDHRPRRPWRAARSRDRPGDRREPHHDGAADRSSRATSRPVDTAVVSVTQIHAGDAYNVIPETRRDCAARCAASATRRWTLIEKNGCARIAEGVAGGFGATAELDFRRAVPAARQRRRRDRIHRRYAPPRWSATTTSTATARSSMASEDFSFMLERRARRLYPDRQRRRRRAAARSTTPATISTTRALPFGASLFARLVERRLARMTGAELHCSRPAVVPAKRWAALLHRTQIWSWLIAAAWVLVSARCGGLRGLRHRGASADRSGAHRLGVAQLALIPLAGLAVLLGVGTTFRTRIGLWVAIVLAAAPLVYAGWAMLRDMSSC